MGQPVKIFRFSKVYDSLSGVKDIKIKFSGLRDGENFSRNS
ncbi:hypothetical protein AAH009_01575 [Parabacteroides merdae]